MGELAYQMYIQNNLDIRMTNNISHAVEGYYSLYFSVCCVLFQVQQCEVHSVSTASSSVQYSSVLYSLIQYSLLFLFLVNFQFCFHYFGLVNGVCLLILRKICTCYLVLQWQRVGLPILAKNVDIGRSTFELGILIGIAYQSRLVQHQVMQPFTNTADQEIARCASSIFLHIFVEDSVWPASLPPKLSQFTVSKGLLQSLTLSLVWCSHVCDSTELTLSFLVLFFLVQFSSFLCSTFSIYCQQFS